MCRSVTNAMVFVATMVMVEDLRGDVEDLSLYNFRASLNDSAWLPKGTIMVIKVRQRAVQLGLMSYRNLT